jgi:NitT/TauT family transport system substrate-binding protein
MRKSQNSKAIDLLIGMALLCILAACQDISTTENPLTPITVQFQWTHQAEFAGFYAADQNGYYAEEGLAVTFLPGGPNIDNLASVAQGTAQFGTAPADQLIAGRAGGQPLQAIAVVYRRSPTVFITLADSGITRPQDFAGKTIRTPLSIATTLHAMTSKVGVSPDQYSEINLASDVERFLTGNEQVWGAFLTGMVVTLQQMGHQPNIIYPDDYGIHFYGDSIFTTDDLLASDPDLVLRFLRATLRGWQWAVENPGQIGAMVVNYEPQADPALEIAKMMVSLPLVNTGEDHIGWMKPEIWAGMEQTLREQGELTAPLDVTQVYTLQFLEEIYP